MNEIKVIFIRKYTNVLPLREGERFCESCLQHINYCQCPQMATLTLSDALYTQYDSGKVHLHFEWTVNNGEGDEP